MADKSFGVDQLDILGTGTPTISAPNQLNLDAHTVAISTSVTVGEGMSAVNISATGISTIAQPANSNPMANWTITNNSASAYRFTGPGQSGSDDNPDLYLVRGHRYIFKHNATTNHPIQIRVANGGAAYTDGITYSDTGNNRTTDGNNLIINLQHDAPARLFYQCTAHGSMVGNIYTVGGPQVISGVVTATSFVGSGANLTNLPAQATIANNADNRIITGGSGVNLNAESNVLYDGTNFGIGKSPSRTLDVQGKIRSSDSVCFGDNSSTPSEGVAIHRPADSTLAFVTNNTERLRITSTGNFGFATSSPVAQTDSSGTALTPVVDLKGTGSIANESGVLTLTRKDNATQGSMIYNSGDDAGLTMRNTDGNGMGFYNGTILALRVDSNGRFTSLGNKPSANAQMLQNTSSTNPEGLYIRFPNASPNTSARHALKFSDSAGDKAVIDSNGNSRNLNNSYGGFSDISLKENIVDAGSQWDDIKNIQVKVFNFKSESASDKRIGVIAQEIETVCPKLVSISYDKDVDGNLLETGVKSVKYSVLYMKAIKALQEAQARIETLEAKVAALEGS